MLSRKDPMTSILCDSVEGTSRSASTNDFVVMVVGLSSLSITTPMLPGSGNLGSLLANGPSLFSDHWISDTVWKYHGHQFFGVAICSIMVFWENDFFDVVLWYLDSTLGTRDLALQYTILLEKTILKAGIPEL